MSGGINPKDPTNPEDNKDHDGMLFLKNKLGNLLSNPLMKLSVIIVFISYILGAIYGCLQFKEGLEIYQIFERDSFAYNYALHEKQYFYNYLFRIQILITEPLDYSSIAIQDSVEALCQNMENQKFITNSSLSESWLRYFKMFVKDPRSQFAVRKYNLTNKIEFINCIRNVFFKYPPAQRFKKDIVFNDDYTDIIATRYMVQAEKINDSVDGKEFLLDLWRIGEEAPFNVISHHSLFLLLSMFVYVMNFTLQAIAITSIIMLAITFFFIPYATVAIWVMFSIISIETGVIGYMTLWGVNLNPTSLVCLIICIGFSVDNSAHIAYAYVSSKSLSPNDKMKNALYSVGVPILQACISTLIGVTVLPLTPSYNFLVFFKTISLVMIFACSHSLMLLPVLLSISDQMFRPKKLDVNEHEIKSMLSNGAATDNHSIEYPKS